MFITVTLKHMEFNDGAQITIVFLPLDQHLLHLLQCMYSRVGLEGNTREIVYTLSMNFSYLPSYSSLPPTYIYIYV